VRLILDGEGFPLGMNPPALGEHTDRFLGSLGYAAADIAYLRAAGVVGPS
jgi:crotonobetainyl-CoA:carnitine CoA-transferase CaiB-like acyl-CoA transferase